MTAVLTSLTAVAVATLAVALAMLLRRDLMMLQQNSYRRERYIRWLRTSGDTTSMPSLLAAVLFFMMLYGMVPLIAAPVAICYGGWRIFTLAVRKYKKPLVWTPRARRIFAVDIVLTLLFCGVSATLFHGASAEKWLYTLVVTLMGCIFLSHVITMVSLWLLQPLENHINRGFYRAAQEKLASMPGLRIVGITGSYGKTSTKHYLTAILSEHYDTLMTPGSFNTTMGVVRTINEYLKPYNEVFVVEMGAKQKGDIAEICRLVHPQSGIVTAVGPQHLETFGSIDNVRDTKFELVDALPADGAAFINNDFEPIAGKTVTNVDTTRYGVEKTDDCQYTASDIVYGPSGTEFTVNGGNAPLRLRTALLGECNISNLLAAVAVARHLGVPDEKIKYAVANIEPVEHRLSTKPGPNGSTIIDDAFNSNPMGSRMALDVLEMMKQGKRFVITPGMIELGDEQEKLNEEFGRHIAQSADYAVIVGKYNREAIDRGLEAGALRPENIMHFNTFLEAFAAVSKLAAHGDTILIENDLPDTFK